MFLCLCLALAQPPVGPPAVTAEKLPDPVKAAEVRTPVGVPVRLASDRDGTRWEVGCAEGKRFYLLSDADGRKATVIAADPGRFTVLAIAAAGPAARTVLVAGEPDPAPPAPGPQPAPPQPQPPPAPPAPPADAFRAAVRAAYLADPGPDKADKSDTLAVLYRQAAALAKDADKFPTAAALTARVAQAAADLPAEMRLAPTDLVAVRKLVAAELKLAADPAQPFDGAARDRLADVYRRAAAALTAP